MIGDNSRRSSSVYSSGTIEGDASIVEAFPFEDDPEFLELPETEKEIQKQAYRNTNRQQK